MKAHQKYEYLVIGSGIAGLYFALKASAYGKVLIVTKDAPHESATAYAQGGIAAALGEMDNPQKHFDDTLVAGAGLCDEKAVHILVNDGVEAVKDLIELGMEFTREASGKLHLGKEGGHNEYRVVHTHDYTGREVEHFLLRLISANKNIEMRSSHCAVDLLTEHQLTPRSWSRTCYGAYVLDERTGVIEKVIASYTVLAAGGAGRIYPHTTNPAVSTGDGVALAYRAGCRVRNMEFFQFHPTSLYAKADPAFLITEAIRGHGAILRLPDGTAFMKNYHEMADLAPRDIVARAIDAELKKNGLDFVWLDITANKAEDTIEHFPLIYKTLKEKFSIDITREMIPVVPAAHYMCGGIVTDTDGKTDLDFLFAIGECASTGVHGGNRLASNSLLEGLVFAKRAVANIGQDIQDKKHERKASDEIRFPEWDKGGAVNLEEWILVKHDLREIQNIMWDYVGILRSRLRLERAIRRIDVIYSEILDFYNRTVVTREILELRNIALVAQMTVRCALKRKESRGLHFMTDYSESREPSREDTILEPIDYKSKVSRV